MLVEGSGTMVSQLANCRLIGRALFTYEGVTNNLKLTDSGAGGLTELVGKLHSSKPMYGLCRVGLTETGQPQIVMVCWVGNNVDEIRRAECDSHVPAIKTFFKEAQVFITASEQDEVTEEVIMAAIAKIRPPMERRRSSKAMDKEETVGTNYKKTNAAMEMRRINRDSFWARAERRRWERERVLQEKKEAEERDRKMNEKLQMIEEQRRVQAQLEEEARREEKSKWELEQREHEEDMRARLRRSESIEKAARSLTDTAFIFERANSTSGPPSPLSPSARSPFSRSQSTSKCPMSPLSPPYRTIPSAPRPQTSPPTSPPPRSVPPVSPLPSLPVSRPPPPLSSPPVRPPPQVPVHDSASPASPKLLDSHDKSESCNYDSSEELAVATESPPASLSENPPHTIELVTSSRILCEQKAVLIEEDEEEVEEPEEPSAMSAPPSDTKITTNYEQAVKTVEEQLEPKDVKTVISPLVEVEEQEEPESESEEEPEEQPAIESEEFQPNVEHLAPEKPRNVELISDDVAPEKPRNVELISDDEVEEDLPENQGEDVDVSEHSTPERYCYTVNREEEDDDEIQTDTVTENGKSSPERLLRVRALYDYQAEDDTELSFEPGDIISDVETIDKAWWRGSSKDGRQGLFPANYVETI
ncbi:Drebrin-like protein [Labeo rohita]|uniref:Drebrin-like protein n=1 Tax=Labeo rohita TaxID=84645 RepID=A0ABQ8MNQ6_LABRO|nr:Drebrin-like protein [Labeo rohita]